MIPVRLGLWAFGGRIIPSRIGLRPSHWRTAALDDGPGLDRPPRTTMTRTPWESAR
jgi:hypothetical protein